MTAIKDYRTRKGLSQEQLARLMGTTQAAVAKAAPPDIRKFAEGFAKELKRCMQKGNRKTA